MAPWVWAGDGFDTILILFLSEVVIVPPNPQTLPKCRGTQKPQYNQYGRVGVLDAEEEISQSCKMLGLLTPNQWLPPTYGRKL